MGKFKVQPTNLLKIEVDTLDNVDSKVKDLYAETEDGKYRLIADVPLEDDFKNTYDALQKERASRKDIEKQFKEVNNRLKEFDGINVSDFNKMKTELDTYKNSSNDVMKLQQANADYKYKVEELTKSNQQIIEKLNAYELERKQNNLKESARKALKNNGVSDYAMEDALLWATNQLGIADDGTVSIKDGVAGMQAGLSVDSWARLMKETKPYLFGGTVGGGAGGSGSSIKISEDWSNTGADGGVNITRLSQALQKDYDTTVAVAKQKGVYDNLIKSYPYLFSKK